MVPFRPNGGSPEGKTVWQEVKVGIVARLGQRITKEVEINNSSVFCCVLSFFMIFLFDDLKRENRCNQNQVQDSAN
jgi:hypothetical protein